MRFIWKVLISLVLTKKAGGHVFGITASEIQEQVAKNGGGTHAWRRMEEGAASTGNIVSTFASSTTSALWRCDDLTPNLCDNLIETSGSFSLGEYYKNISVHYWRFSLPDAKKKRSNSNNYPVIVINGGPGMPHNYDLPLRQLACRDGGREVIFYDQAGSGKSSLPPNASLDSDYAFLLSASYYGEQELPALIQALDLGGSNFHIVADSWGTLITLQFAIFSQSPVRQNLASLVLNGPIPNTMEYFNAGWDPVTGTIGTLPKYFQQRYKVLSAEKRYDSEEYQAMEQVLMTDFLYHNGIMADCFLDAAATMNAEVYMKLWGPSEFIAGNGTLNSFDMFPHLFELSKLPILLTMGEYDAVRPSTVQKMHANLRLSETIVFAHSGAHTLGDVPGLLLEAVADFLNRVESSRTFVPMIHHPDSSSSYSSSTPSTTYRHSRTSILFLITAMVALGIGLYFGKRSFLRLGVNRHRYETVV